jgi:hypothetical protein
LFCFISGNSSFIEHFIAYANISCQDPEIDGGAHEAKKDHDIAGEPRVMASQAGAIVVLIEEAARSFA